MSAPVPPFTDEDLLAEIRNLLIQCRNDPNKKLAIKLEWYEQAYRSNPAKAAKGMMLLTVLAERDGVAHEQDLQPTLSLHGNIGKRVVISLHGIRTRGVWQKQLASALSRANFIYEPLDYGFFRAVQLVLPFLRDSKTKWFLAEYSRIAPDPHKDPPSVIAHSFGTYLVARTLRKYEEVRFDRIIFCGSIVECGFPWTSIFQRHRVTRVLNDYGAKDFWAKSSEWFVNDAGPSGAKGFSDDANGKVIKRYRPEFRHSDFFYKANYEGTWIPFLEGKDPDPTSSSPRRPANWKFRIVALVLLLLLALLFLFAAKHIRDHSAHDESTPSPAQPVDQGLPTKAQRQLSELKREYSEAEERINKLGKILSNTNSKYNFLDLGRISYYRREKDKYKQFLDATSDAAASVAKGEVQNEIPQLPEFSLGWPNPSVSAAYTLWHENQTNNNFTDLYVTIYNGNAVSGTGGAKLTKPDGTVQQLVWNTSLPAEFAPSPASESITVDGIQIISVERFAFAWPGHLSLAGSQVEATSPNGTAFASTTVGQPAALNR